MLKHKQGERPHFSIAILCDVLRPSFRKATRCFMAQRASCGLKFAGMLPEMRWQQKTTSRAIVSVAAAKSSCA